MSHWETSGHSDEWYTPKFVFDALGCYFDCDVAAPWDTDNICVPTDHWICADSLTVPWDGFVWMNPPYGGRNSLKPWLDKFFSHGNGIALVPDRTSAPWFQEAFSRAQLALFTRKIRFLRPDGTEGKSPSNGSCLLAAGGLAIMGLNRAHNAGLGVLCRPAETPKLFSQPHPIKGVA